MPAPKLWNRGLARASIMGHEPTMNPTLAASSLLRSARGGARAIAKARKARKSYHRGNPLPAAVGVLGGLGKILSLPKFLKQPSEKRAAAVAQELVNSAVQGNLTAAKAIRDRTTFGIAAERAVWSQALAQIPQEIRATVEKHWSAIPGVDHKGPETAARDALARPFALPGTAAAVGMDPRVLQAGAGVATALGKQLIQSATRKTRTTRVRQVTRYDPATGDKYKVPSNSMEAASWPSRKPSARSLGGGIAAGAAAGAPIVGKAAGLAGAGAGAIAGVVIGGLAVGLLIGTGLRKLFGTAKAVRAEEAAAQGAIVLRNTRAQLEAQLGRKLTAKETRAMFDEYAAQLVQLGFVQNAQGMWHRPRSFTERLLG